MTVHAGGLLGVGIAGDRPTAELGDLLEELRPGAVVLFRRDGRLRSRPKEQRPGSVQPEAAELVPHIHSPVKHERFSSASGSIITSSAAVS